MMMIDGDDEQLSLAVVVAVGTILISSEEGETEGEITTLLFIGLLYCVKYCHQLCRHDMISETLHLCALFVKLN